MGLENLNDLSKKIPLKALAFNGMDVDTNNNIYFLPNNLII